MSRSARVQKIIDEAARLTPAERAELAEELSEPLVFTKEELERQRRAVLDFLAIPTFHSGSSDVSSEKYGALHKRRHDGENG
jgi:hypothetical protein